MANVRLAANNLQQLPAAAMTWRLDADAFDELTLELILRQDHIPLRRALVQAVPTPPSSTRRTSPRCCNG